MSAGVAGAWVKEVDGASFEAEVIQGSQEALVLVDFWAPWCGPCRALTPVLEALVAERGGEVILAKVNTDENPQLSAQFQIRGIPAVKAFQGGALVGEFTGAQTRPFIEKFIADLKPSEAQVAAAKASELFQTGHVADAVDQYRTALAMNPSDSEILVGLGAALLRAGHIEDAADTLSDVRQGEKGWEEAQGLLGEISFHQRVAEVGDVATCRARLEADPTDHEARLALAAGLYLQGEHRAALEALLELVRLDKRWGDEAGRKTMLVIFERIGNRSALSDEFRTRLSRTLY